MCACAPLCACVCVCLCAFQQLNNVLAEMRTIYSTARVCLSEDECLPLDPGMSYAVGFTTLQFWAIKLCLLPWDGKKKKNKTPTTTTTTKHHETRLYVYMYCLHKSGSLSAGRFCIYPVWAFRALPDIRGQYLRGML